MSDGSISIKLAPDYGMTALQSAVENPENSDYDDILRNEDFFPAIIVSEFRHAMRTDGTITEPRLRAALIEAMASVNYDLREFAQAHADAGSLAYVPCARIDGKSLNLWRYQRAVHCLALANLYERYASYDTTNDGEKKMAMLKDSINELRRDARFALSDIKQTSRIIVELI